jgi:tripartite ATP-independent transporter DctP family solute receptor
MTAPAKAGPSALGRIMSYIHSKFASVSAAALIGFALLSVSEAGAVTLKMGYALQRDSHFGDGAAAFGESLKRLSNGKFETQEFPSGQLGGERPMLEGLQIGTVDVYVGSTGAAGNFVPEVELFNIPFLFKDYAHARAVQDGPIGQQLLDKMTEQGLVALSWGEGGFRHFTSNDHPIRTPADLAGLKLRTMENAMHIEAFSMAGALPAPMAFAELYTALQTGTMDAEENPVPVIIAGRFFEVQKYLSLSSHAFTSAATIVSPTVWESLTDEEKGWFRQAADDAKAAMRARIDKDEASGLQFLKEHGMEIVTDVDRDAFREVLEPAYVKYREQFGAEVIDAITQAP